MDLVEVTSSNFGDPGFVVTAFDKVDFGERYGCSPLLLGYLTADDKFFRIFSAGLRWRARCLGRRRCRA